MARAKKIQMNAPSYSTLHARLADAEQITNKYTRAIRSDAVGEFYALKAKGVKGNPTKAQTQEDMYARCRSYGSGAVTRQHVSVKFRGRKSVELGTPGYGIHSYEDMAHDLVVLCLGGATVRRETVKKAKLSPNATNHEIQQSHNSRLEEVRIDPATMGTNRTILYMANKYRTAVRKTAGDHWSGKVLASISDQEAEQEANGIAAKGTSVDATLTEAELYDAVSKLAEKFGPVESMIVRQVDAHTIAEQTGVCLATVYNRKKAFEKNVREMIGV